MKNCGARGIRTPDLFHAMEARYQLRHSPDVGAPPGEEFRAVRGARGIRTPDLFHAMEARYQLRHSPVRASLACGDADNCMETGPVRANPRRVYYLTHSAEDLAQRARVHRRPGVPLHHGPARGTLASAHERVAAVAHAAQAEPLLRVHAQQIGGP